MQRVRRFQAIESFKASKESSDYSKFPVSTFDSVGRYPTRYLEAAFGDDYYGTSISELTDAITEDMKYNVSEAAVQWLSDIGEGAELLFRFTVIDDSYEGQCCVLEELEGLLDKFPVGKWLAKKVKIRATLYLPDGSAALWNYNLYTGFEID